MRYRPDETEIGFLRQSTVDGWGQYSYILTQCGNWLYCHNGTTMKYNHKICPKCGKVIVIEGVEEE